VKITGTNEAPVAQDITFEGVPDGWTLDPATNHIYKYVAAPGISWSAAQAQAQSQGGYLATVQSQTENNLVFGLVNNNVAWLGSSDAGVDSAGNSNEGKWKWVTEPGGGNPAFGSWTAWAGGEPNNQGDGSFSSQGEDYLVTWGNGQWNDLDNSSNDLQY